MHAHAAETASDAHTQKTAESLPHQEALPGPEFESIAWKAGESREKIQTPAGTVLGRLAHDILAPNVIFVRSCSFCLIFVKRVPAFGSMPSRSFIQNSSLRERRVERSNKSQLDGSFNSRNAKGCRSLHLIFGKRIQKDFEN